MNTQMHACRYSRDGSQYSPIIVCFFLNGRIKCSSTVYMVRFRAAFVTGLVVGNHGRSVGIENDNKIKVSLNNSCGCFCLRSNTRNVGQCI